MSVRLRLLAPALIVIVTTAFGASVHAGQVSLIRDAEIENTIRAYATPLFAAAGLESSSVKIHLVNDKRLNAFVAGGLRLFINTGLLLASETPNQVIGVIAHETGHIAGGHLARTDEALRGANVATILAAVVGAAAVVAGSPDAAVAVLLGGRAIAQQTLLKYSRGQEQAADQFAVSTLESTGQSARGMLEFLEKLEDQELLVASRQDPYLRTHPLTRGRIDFVRNHVANSAYSDAPPRADQDAAFRRMQGKLRGCFESREKIRRLYPESDRSVEARYARTFAEAGLLSCPHRRADIGRALFEIDSLITDDPEDAYFHELRGQILFENGRGSEALGSYRRSVELAPGAPLIRVGLAQALVESNDRAALAEATGHLEIAVRQDDENARAWRLLSIVYGRADRFGMSALASAEQAMLTSRPKDARSFAQRAGKLLPAGSPGGLRAEDIERAAENDLKRRKRK
ncbi:MAG: M48 family metalloprotease [Proteobacteria bacterium]|nr:M48 family metalloprotease [Pseudomonadota bacterium]